MKGALLCFLVGLMSLLPSSLCFSSGDSRRIFLQKSVSVLTGAAIGTVASVSNTPAALAAPEIFNTPGGLKYAITKQPKDLKKAIVPAKGDIVAIEYTGYLTSGQIFDATHAEGKGNALTFQLGTSVVVDGLNEIIGYMGVGQKVQVIVPPQLAFGDKGLCLEGGECLIKPGQTLVYDVFLKKTAVPPP
ncbi:FKBP-type 22 kDa peptidyl-prolyl cis-trans isomerase [Seminavis robusta]|uniref:peptidylprolyl isomerase n=1 Tax=Seminavis robusta TaxID=568900 RepID=A0A9N8DCH5_9STRA|nr:FKBP-type 22 kDa peptidyl-prolyl cis-trans isomerase [Seminavis robusta]|eukprot:Sro33_g021460.1 FKBP-type 22 kDa peptidyl-prolyl cis-trans isomerase (189) ;mRNA; f:83394-83960